MPETTYPAGTPARCNRCDQPFALAACAQGHPFHTEPAARLIGFSSCPHCGQTDAHWVYAADLGQAAGWREKFAACWTGLADAPANLRPEDAPEALERAQASGWLDPFQALLLTLKLKPRTREIVTNWRPACQPEKTHV